MAAAVIAVTIATAGFTDDAGGFALGSGGFGLWPVFWIQIQSGHWIRSRIRNPDLD